jgi:hypothetical protein
MDGSDIDLGLSSIVMRPEGNRSSRYQATSTHGPESIPATDFLCIG